MNIKERAMVALSQGALYTIRGYRKTMEGHVLTCYFCLLTVYNTFNTALYVI